MRVLLADDHLLFTGGLKNLLEAGGVTVVDLVRDGATAVAAVRKYLPDVVLMDIQMPGCDGLTATRLIKAEFPQTKIVILTMNDDDQLLLEAIKNGASGYLLKNLEAESFLELLAGLAEGETVFSPGLAERLLPIFIAEQGEEHARQATDGDTAKPLTARQEQVLTYVAQGRTYKQVAELLRVSERTIKFHMNEILARLHLDNKVQAIAYALQANLTESDT
ncbi:Transcriptional regulatory protein DegU [Sporomusa silvacetica DSM 10669]|uniref:Transcriptional regulatory protein DegU n=1 Tax=Sporomusa silvacetica DSM 10669 TaxID=1123289 RepID=A0ABZ3IQF9_9FIRM|nr:response regulator transcription factor [Sporomusa silvacetica]OZC23791.1 transcriptional regulatory protein DegU [Sporomusa silvacetica DSM 10669]